MSETSPANPPRSKWFWLLLPLVPLLPLYLVGVGVVLLCVYVVAEVQRRMRAWRLRRTMRRAGRVMSWSELEPLIENGATGTIIVDHPCMGWGDQDVWWTCEQVREETARAGVTMPDGLPEDTQADAFQKMLAEVPFHRWCRERYLDGVSGRAVLVRSTHWGRQGTATQTLLESKTAGRPHPHVLLVHTGFLEMVDAREPASGTE